MALNTAYGHRKLTDLHNLETMFFVVYSYITIFIQYQSLNYLVNFRQLLTITECGLFGKILKVVVAP